LVNFIHCIIHIEALASRDLEPKLHYLLHEEVRVVNFVEAPPLKSFICSFLWGNTGRPRVASLAFGGEVVIKG
jgi:hypothetical protein